MKKTILTFLTIAFFVFVPLAVGAHMMGDAVNGGDAGDDRVSVEEFEEIQGTMIKMMNGEDLTKAEWAQMNTFMDSHHSAWDTFGNHMTEYAGRMPGYGMHMYNGARYSVTYWMTVLAIIVWLVVGILLSVVLIRKINKPRNHE